MANPATLPVEGKTFPMPFGQAMMSGRISARRKIKTNDGSFFLTVLKLPAMDAYSHPSTVELRSHDALGNPGDDWRGSVQLSGYPRSYDSKPDADGVITKITSAQNVLEVIEA